MKNEDQGTNKSQSDWILWLLAAAVAVILFLVPKTPVWTAICLAGLAALLIHPVTQIPGIRLTRRRRVLAGMSTVALVCAFGAAVWPDSSAAAWVIDLEKHREEFQKIVSGASFQRCCWILLGMALLRFFQLSRLFLGEAVANRRQVGISEKGFLDFKMQAEEGMGAITPVLSRMAAIQGSVAKHMSEQVLNTAKWVNEPAKIQVRRVKAVAKKLHSLSTKMNVEATLLQKISDPMVEGVDGWMKWMGTRQSLDPSAREVYLPMSQFVATLNGVVDTLDGYLKTIDDLHGVSQEMNHAVDAHWASVKRIRDVTENLRNSYSRALGVLESPSAKGC
jgi:hypothetical protein